MYNLFASLSFILLTTNTGSVVRNFQTAVVFLFYIVGNKLFIYIEFPFI